MDVGLAATAATAATTHVERDLERGDEKRRHSPLSERIGRDVWPPFRVGI